MHSSNIKEEICEITIEKREIGLNHLPLVNLEIGINHEENLQNAFEMVEAAKEEQVTIDFAFATVVSIKAIKKGEHFTKENLWVKRPGTGKIRAEFYNDVLGKVAKRDIKSDEHIDWSDINE